MAFSAGAQFGAYEILAPLGAGGWAKCGERFLVKAPRERRTLQIHVLLNLPSLVPATGP